MEMAFAGMGSVAVASGGGNGSGIETASFVADGRVDSVWDVSTDGVRSADGSFGALERMTKNQKPALTTAKAASTASPMPTYFKIPPPPADGNGRAAFGMFEGCFF